MNKKFLVLALVLVVLSFSNVACTKQERSAKIQGYALNTNFVSEAFWKLSCLPGSKICSTK